MPLFLIAAVGVVVVGYLVLNRSQGPSLAGTAPGTLAPGITLARVQGAAPGTIPAGITLPGQSVEGPGPNTTGALVSSGGAAGGGLAVMAGTTAGITALGAATLGIGAVIGVGLALWQAHLARVKGAKDENAVLNELVPGFSQSLSNEFSALNSGRVSPTTALQDLEQIRSSYWQAIAPYQKGPGQHTHTCVPLGSAPDPRPTAGWASGCSPQGAGQTTCDKTCTAGCCIGCDWIEPVICTAKAVIQAGGGTVKIPPTGGSKYGFAGSAAYTLVYTPPAGGGYGL